MSRVFVATERALGRRVVIKVLPDAAAGALSVERFKREIAFAARLQQANIVPVLSAGDMNGLPFFIMPFVEGESLRTRLASGGELPIPETVGILKEVARALTYAHDQGVVHRDIKPDNVLLSGGTAMVTDFGVAKALSAATADGAGAMTGTGVSLGTPAYMAPEQASADPHVDHRADIYAFGCLAYELLSGASPFAGRSAQAMISAHLTEEADPVERRRTTVSGPLASLVARCLAKNPADRPQSARELTQALDQVSSGPVAAGARATSRPNRTPIVVALLVIVAVGGMLLLLPLVRNRPGTPPSLTVLPMENPSGDTGSVYIAEGLTDELRSQLTQVSGLSVMARSSSVALAQKHVSLSEIGAKHNIGFVLQGTVSPVGGRLRMTLELVSTGNGAAIWSGTFTFNTTELSAVRDSVARSVAGKFRLAGGGAAVARRAENPEARDLYLRGRFLATKSSQRELRQSLVYFAQALERDPGMAEAHSGIAWTWAALADAYVSPAEAYPRTKAAALRAIALDSMGAEAYLALGEALAFHDWDFTGAERALRRAMTLRPNYAEAHSMFGLFLPAMGRADESIAQLDTALALDPLYVLGGWQRAWVLYSAHGRYREALAQYQRMLELDPQYFYLESMEGAAYRELGLPDSAFAAFARAAPLAGSQPMGQLAVAYAKVGRRNEAVDVVRALEKWYGQHYYPPEYVAAAWASVGEMDQAFTWMNKVFEVRSSLWLFFGKAPEFDTMRRDARWGVLERRARGQ